MKIAIIGGGGCAREVKRHILDNNKDQIVHFFVSDEYVSESLLPLSQLNVMEYMVLVAIGDPIIRQRMVKSLPPGVNYHSFIHRSAQLLDENIKIGVGAIILANVIITTNVVLGNHSLLHYSTTIGHDTIAEDYFTTAPGVNISGNCEIGNNVYLGANCSIREKIKIVDDVTIGLGAAVVKDINQKGVYVGNPAKKLP